MNDTTLHTVIYYRVLDDAGQALWFGAAPHQCPVGFCSAKGIAWSSIDKRGRLTGTTRQLGEVLSALMAAETSDKPEAPSSGAAEPEAGAGAGAGEGEGEERLRWN